MSTYDFSEYCVLVTYLVPISIVWEKFWKHNNRFIVQTEEYFVFQLSQVVADNPSLIAENYKVCKVLDLICEKAMKSRDTDDVMAIKAHYFATLIRHAKDSKDMATWIKR